METIDIEMQDSTTGETEVLQIFSHGLLTAQAEASALGLLLKVLDDSGLFSGILPRRNTTPGDQAALNVILPEVEAA